MSARVNISSIPGGSSSGSSAPGIVGSSPGEVAAETGGGGMFEVTLVTVGISPESAETERVNVRATVNMNRFIGVTPYLRKIM